jgi:hypothetical protein
MFNTLSYKGNTNQNDTPVKMVIIKNTVNNERWQGWGRGSLTHSWWKC